MRRANGSGSVYKRPDNVHRRKPWVAVVNLGMTDTGKRRKKIIGSFERQRDAQAALEAYNMNPQTAAAADITWADVWERIAVGREHMRKPLSKVHLMYWKNHVSKIASLKISETKTLHLQQIIDESNVSASGQSGIMTVMHMLYRYAIANDLIIKDYSRFVVTAVKVKSDIHKPFTTEEMRLLWKHCNDDIARIILIQTYTGMRPKELAMIKIDHVNLSARTMTGGLKTDAGRNRTIPIAECILPFVIYFYSISKFAKHEYLVMPDRQRGLYGKNGLLSITYSYRKYLEKIGIAGHLPHNPRHTFITIADNYSMPEKIQKMIVGHVSGNNVTKDVYTHKIIPQLIAAVDALPHGENMTIYPDENGSQLEATDTK